MELMLWNTVLTMLIGVIAYIGHEKGSEIKRLNILLNKTREEVARDSVTQAEVTKLMERLDDSFTRLEAKIDRFGSKIKG